jgi:chaperonin GroES
MADAVDLEPLHDFILVDVIPPGETKGGIVIPETVQEGTPRAKVIKAGPGRMTESGSVVPMPVKVGDVIYLILGGPPVTMTFGGKNYALIRARDVAGKQTSK